VITRQNTAELFRALRAEGMVCREIAEETGYAVGTVRAYLNDPNGSRDRARKDGYLGTCEVCGSPTTGCNGPGLAPLRCIAHARDKHWTRGRVIEAIQHFAARHGRPPVASDWNHRGRSRRYPAATSAYRAGAYSSSPFATWADAIEAAGFPRPIPGHYERTPEILRRYSEAQKRRYARARAAR